MDPVTGIGLAASLVQLVQFAITTAKTGHEIYERGLAEDNIDIGQRASHLADLTQSVRSSLQKSKPGTNSLSKEERELVHIASKSQDCANKLKDELKKLEITPHASVPQAIRKTFRSMRKKGAILKLQEQLEAYRSILETSLLQSLSQRFDAQALRVNAIFSSLDENIKHLIECLADSKTSLDAIVREEAEQTRQHFDTQLKQALFDERFYSEVTRSLFYPEITSRQEHVANEFDGIEDSYDWIFDEPTDPQNSQQKGGREQIKQDSTPRWSNFSEWLRSGTETYWINGKAGSGKSTLMHRICKHKVTYRLLQEWSGDRLLLTPTFFFWNAGTLRQKSIDGLLRSLLYQLLTQCRDFVSCFEDELLHTWTVERLLLALSRMLTLAPVPVAVCLFIDGLDEFEGQYDAVINSISKLSSQDYVKCCLSSRPLTSFERAFSENPSLRVQDLTYDSIYKYVNCQLSSLITQRSSLYQGEQTTLQRLLRDLVSRADGVFLWAVIATRDLRDGLQDMASLQELEVAIEGLPSGVENLYLSILNRIKPAYQRVAVMFLQTVLYDAEYLGAQYPLDILRLNLIEQQWTSEDKPLLCKNLDYLDLVRDCLALRTRLLSHTMGLLDLAQPEVVEWVDHDVTHKEMLKTAINFHHRSVKEFLLYNDAAKSFVASAGIKEEEARLSIARGSICELIYRARMDLESPSYLEFKSIILARSFDQIATVERILDTAQSKLLRSLNDHPSLYRVPQGWGDQVGWYPCEFGTSDGKPNEVMIDFVGLAADRGMVRYVCEILECQYVSSRRHHHSILESQQSYSTDKVIVPTASWRQPVNLDLRASKYWDRLSECICVDRAASEGEASTMIVDNRKLAATYLLACQDFPSEDIPNSQQLQLIHTLLQEGADPMMDKLITRDCFWKKWLLNIQELCWRYPRGWTNETPSRGPNLEQLRNQGVSLDDLWEMTRALLVSGASINYKITTWAWKERRLSSSYIGIVPDVTALYLLHACFPDKAELQEFTAAVNAPPKRYWRGLPCLMPVNARYSWFERPFLRLIDEDREILWPALEKWEETGQVADFDSLYEIVRQIWNAKTPDYRYVPKDLNVNLGIYWTERNSKRRARKRSHRGSSDGKMKKYVNYVSEGSGDKSQDGSSDEYSDDSTGTGEDLNKGP